MLCEDPFEGSVHWNNNNNSNNNRSSSSEQWHELVLGPVGRWYGSVHIYMRPAICVLGVLANFAIVLVLLRASMRRNVINILLTAIAVWDMSLMATYAVWGLVSVCHPVFFSYWWNVYTVFYANYSVVAHSASLWSTVLLATLRVCFLRCTHRNRPLRQDNVFTALWAIGVATGLALFGSIPNFLRNQISDLGPMWMSADCHDTNDTVFVHGFAVHQPDWWNCRWERTNFWLTGLLFKLLPCLLLTIFMTMLVQVLVAAKRNRQRLRSGDGKQTIVDEQTDRTTSMLILIMLIFLITELPQGFVVIAIGVEPSMAFLHQHLGDILDALSLINSCVNFVLYCTMSSEFRSQFAATFRLCTSRPVRLTGHNDNLTSESDKSNNEHVRSK